MSPTVKRKYNMEQEHTTAAINRGIFCIRYLGDFNPCALVKNGAKLK